MQTLSQYLEEARKDYTYANVRVYRREPNDFVPCIKQVSGSIDFVSEYFKKDIFGNHMLLAGRFTPVESHLRGHHILCVCRYRKEE